MSNENQYKQLFHAIMKYEEEMHLKNQKRIKIGIQCLIWIPMVFLILLFLTESDKVVFLVLWIISLFVIAVYLIYVEYVDFQMQEKIAEISSGEPIEANALIGQDINEVEQNIVKTLKELEQKRDETKERVKEQLVQRIETRKDSIRGLLDKGEPDNESDKKALKEGEADNEEHTENHGE